MGVRNGLSADKEEGHGSRLEVRENSVELVTRSPKSPESEHQPVEPLRS